MHDRTAVFTAPFYKGENKRLENRTAGVCWCLSGARVQTSQYVPVEKVMVLIWSNNLNLLYGHKTKAWCNGSWLTTTDFHQGFNDRNNVLNTASAGIHFREGGEKKKILDGVWSICYSVFYLFFFCREEFMKKSLTSLIYVYRHLNRQVVSGARGALNRST